MGLYINEFNKLTSSLVNWLKPTHNMDLKTMALMDVYKVGMGDIGVLAYDYCHEQISRLSRLLPTYWKYYIHYELSIKWQV